uniref:WS_DGAT_C domain-containing protein n=1 Tax=Steinernema glaseri TaxID=37863 RepID=A0A1I7Y692_9BILA
MIVLPFATVSLEWKLQSGPKGALLLRICTAEIRVALEAAVPGVPFFAPEWVDLSKRLAALLAGLILRRIASIIVSSSLRNASIEWRFPLYAMVDDISPVKSLDVKQYMLSVLI